MEQGFHPQPSEAGGINRVITRTAGQFGNFNLGQGIRRAAMHKAHIGERHILVEGFYQRINAFTAINDVSPAKTR
ncbi:hypothetical protein GCM10023116_49620 [Kistimonas scapharcae]|uniref:Uncharacterized protein n=1 Tax=Kistimonas scapharcae TaxID=1036133 RepID=A0ABP8V8U8_9GAMM